MTDYKCLTKCVKNCDKLCKVGPEHTNKDCHLNKFCCCYELGKGDDAKKLDRTKNESKVCKTCCCLVDKCQCKSPHNERCVCCKKSISPGQEFCKICCCLITNCICKDKLPKQINENLRSRTLCEDLPLYDEKSHLIGYIKKGAIIDEPFCVKSRDKELENKSNSDSEAWPRARCGEADRPCMASCRYAEGVRRDSGNVGRGVSRWTTRTAYDNAIRYTSPVRPRRTSPSKLKSRKKPCPCEK